METRGPVLDRFGITQALREIGALLRLKGGNPFRARAYEKAADATEGVADLETLVTERRLTDVPGVGASLAGVIEELHRTGSARLLEGLRKELGPGVLELTQVVSLSKARVLHEALGVTTLDALRRACVEGRVREVKGFGARTEAKLLAAIEHHEAREEKHLLVDALEVAERLRASLAEAPGVLEVAVAGGVRRFVESVDELVLVARASSDRLEPSHSDHLERATASREAASRELASRLAKFIPSSVEGLARRDRFSATDEELRVRLPSGLPVRLVLASPEEFGAALLRATGPDTHVAELEARGPLAGAREEDVYANLSLPFVPAEPREIPRSFEQTWDDLVAIEDVRGMTHCHTRYSDGKATIEEMALAAEELGAAFITITDHSQSAGYAGGLGPKRLEKQWAEIDAVQERVKIRLLRGTESDIRADGSLDYDDSVLEKLDVVIASIHDRMKMDEDQMTARLVRCMKLPVFKIWGHALGRLVERRPPIACRVEEVLDAAAESGRVAIEVNGDPYRLDMEPRWIRAARERRLPFVISTDAHSRGGLRVLRFGVGIARRGGIRRGEVLNALPADEFVKAVRPVR